ncbi:unnamed protein product [Tilletia controversa]|uniref:Elongator complex protein 5 n=3 Tax=Tilletia TaxID=13289 RepID=A0A8X7MQS2_9BASI|nr:hypothetical protein CF336_g1900 [Tilletia laevis]KAE8200334.1 hypothetical protein CF328_g2995 [Tilletia controversa]KAE8262287.1 hypothetical protein A4X03_0g2576 [Tilletia caries]KAE8199905.1 hypothetical protein CF335_g4058 [Tilletia laevis]KAE8245977.1 hypothetical protein A4X06_0g5283 [Tilletia controversa]
MSSRSSRTSSAAALAAASPTSILKKVLFDHAANVRSLVVLQDCLVQSSAPVIREVIARGIQSVNTVTVLVCALGRPQIYVPSTPTARPAIEDGRLVLLDGTRWFPEFGIMASSSQKTGGGDDAARTFGDTSDLLVKIRDVIENTSRNSRITVIFDSVEELVGRSKGGVFETTKVISEALGSLNGISRLILGLKLDYPHTNSASLFDNLCSPLIWPSGPGRSDTGRGTTTVIRIHPPGLIAHIYRTYGLRPPVTKGEVAVSLESEDAIVAGQSSSSLLQGPESGVARTRRTAEDHHQQHSEKELASKQKQRDSSHPQDAKFWEISSLLASRGDSSLGGHGSGSAAQIELGWWTLDRASGGAGLIDALSSPNLSALSTREGQAITLLDVLGSKRDDKSRRGAGGRGVEESGNGLDADSASLGLVLLEARHRTQAGKLEEEILGCTCTSSGRLRLHPLDMVDRRRSSTATTPAVHQPSQHAQQKEDVQPSQRQRSTDSSTPSAVGTGSTLSFNLTETEEQRARRAEVPLPYAHMQSQEPIMFDEGRMGVAASTTSLSAGDGPSLGGARRGHTGNSTILFEPESDDDEDDEDPDDDLDF